MYRFGGQSASGGGELSGGSEGCVYVELTTSGAKWGRGPTVSDIHGGNKRSVDSPAWRHMQMLKTLVSEDGNRVLIPGFYDNIEPLSPTMKAKLKAGAKNIDMKIAAENLGVARFIADDPLTFLTMARYGTSMNLDGNLGRQHVRGRGRRHSAEQDHVEAQLPLPAEAGRHRHYSKAAGASRRAGLW
jgi:hypothetical protein